MKLLSPKGPTTDATLLEQCLDGNCEAFRELVERHQSLVCAITFSACGRVAVSEELAQEVFVIAWRRLTTLREPGHFKAWLCGIARNVANSATRHEQRRGTEVPLEAMAELPHSGPAPDEAAIRQQEEALVWEAIAEIPETYREPLVLYYREQQSMRAVAAALDLTEEAVRQRLSRGRSLLKEQVAAAVERTLTGSGPQKTLGLAVLAAISKPASASAATLGVAAKTGLAATKFSFLMVLPLIASVFSLVEHNHERRDARTDRERAFIRYKNNVYVVLMVLAGLAPVVIEALMKSAGAPSSPTAPLVWFTRFLPFLLLLVVFVKLRHQRQLREIQIEEGTRVQPAEGWNPLLDRSGKLSRLNLFRYGLLPLIMWGFALQYLASRGGDEVLGNSLFAGALVIAIVCGRICARRQEQAGQILRITQWVVKLILVVIVNLRWSTWVAVGKLPEYWTLSWFNGFILIGCLFSLWSWRAFGPKPKPETNSHHF
jgi:RNA polymerase sigma factor (sigma-70 family)